MSAVTWTTWVRLFMVVASAAMCIDSVLAGVAPQAAIEGFLCGGLLITIIVDFDDEATNNE